VYTEGHDRKKVQKLWLQRGSGLLNAPEGQKKRGREYLADGRDQGMVYCAKNLGGGVISEPCGAVDNGHEGLVGMAKKPSSAKPVPGEL